MEKDYSRRWLKSILISLGIFIFFSFYLFLRRGYYDLYIINKVLGSTAVVVAGATLVFGPLARKYPSFSSWSAIRKELGLIAFGLAIAHIGASLLLQNKFPFPSWYFGEWIPISFGLLAIVVWTYMTLISSKKNIDRLGFDIWKKRLSLAGNLGFIAIFLHLVIMKYQGWIRWFNGQVKASPELANPGYPPASLFVFISMVIVIVYRIVITYRYKSES